MSKRFLLIVIILFNAMLRVHGQNADLRLLQSINGPASGADQTWKNVTNSVGFTSSLAPATMLVVGLANHDKELTVKAFETGASVVIAEGIALGMKSVIKRQRPGYAYPTLIYVKTEAGGYSLPSGHTSLAFATATSLSLSFPKWYVIAPSFGYATAVGYSRVYLGAHYPTDIAAGALVGAGSAFLSWEIQKLLNKKYHYH